MKRRNLILGLVVVALVFLGSVAQAVAWIPVIDLQMNGLSGNLPGGTLVTDSSAFGNNGTVEDNGDAGTIFGVPGHTGSGIELGGGGDRIRVTGFPSITGPLKVSLWIYPYEYVDGSGWNKTSPSSNPNPPGGWGGYGIYIDASGSVSGNVHGLMSFETAGGPGDFTVDGNDGPTVLNLDDWNYLEMTFDGDRTYSLTVNGSSNSWMLPSTDTIRASTVDLTIGGPAPWLPSGSGSVVGIVDEFKIETIPEPGSLLTLGIGLIGLAGFALRQRRI
jgi:hypothetical protein